MTARLLLLGTVAVAVIASAVAVVHAKHRSRVLFDELLRVTREQDELKIQWGRLQLEQSTLASHRRVEQYARERLQMLTPQGDDMQVLLP